MSTNHCPNCHYPDCKDGQSFKGIYTSGKQCDHCGWLELRSGLQWRSKDREFQTIEEILKRKKMSFPHTSEPSSGFERLLDLLDGWTATAYAGPHSVRDNPFLSYEERVAELYQIATGKDQMSDEEIKKFVLDQVLPLLLNGAVNDNDDEQG